MTIKEQLKALEDHCSFLWEIYICRGKENDVIAMTDRYCSEDIFKTIYESEYANKKCIDWHFSYCENGSSLDLTIE